VNGDKVEGAVCALLNRGPELKGASLPVFGSDRFALSSGSKDRSPNGGFAPRSGRSPVQVALKVTNAIYSSRALLQFFLSAGSIELD